MSYFKADPSVIKNSGNKVISFSEMFSDRVNNIYSVVEEMVSSDYLSPEAVAIANKIESYRGTLNDLRLTIENYGNFLVKTSNMVVENQEDIISSIH